MDKHSTDIYSTKSFNTTIKPDLLPENDASYIWIPFAVLIGILILSAFVYLMARNRRQLNPIFCKRKLFGTDDYSHLDDDYFVASDNNSAEYTFEGKLYINNHDSNYQSTTDTRLSVLA